jgi:hypothetical protein
MGGDHGSGAGRGGDIGLRDRRVAAARPCRGRRGAAAVVGRTGGGAGPRRRGYPRWRSGLERIDGMERRGPALRFVEHRGGDAIAFLLTEEVPGARFKSVIDDPDLPFGGYWTIALVPEGAGTRVRIEEHGFVGNFAFRFVSALVLGHDRTMKTYLADLARAVSA